MNSSRSRWNGFILRSAHVYCYKNRNTCRLRKSSFKISLALHLTVSKGCYVSWQIFNVYYCLSIEKFPSYAKWSWMPFTTCPNVVSHIIYRQILFKKWYQIFAHPCLQLKILLKHRRCSIPFRHIRSIENIFTPKVPNRRIRPVKRRNATYVDSLAVGLETIARKAGFKQLKKKSFPTVHSWVEWWVWL